MRLSLFSYMDSYINAMAKKLIALFHLFALISTRNKNKS